MTVKMYFKGGKGILNPIDMDGKPIKEGSILTKDYGDYERIGLTVKTSYATDPFYLVKWNDKGFFYAESFSFFESAIFGQSRFYLHDFRFKFCKCLN